MSFFRRILPDDYVTQSGITVANLAAIAIEARMSSYYSAGSYDPTASNPSGIYGLGDVRSVNMKAFNEAEVRSSLEVSGSIGDINLYAAASADISAYFSAGQGSAGSGDIGDVTLQTIGQESSAYIELTASGGSIGRIKVVAANPNGDAEVSAWSYSGDIAGLDYLIRGGKASGRAAVSAFGGDIGYINIVSNAASGSGYFSAYASAIAASDGTAMGGDIGDISLMSRGMSGDYDLYASAYGLVQDGNYVGGGNIGDISIQNIQIQGGSGELEGYFKSYSGGDIGEINVRQILVDAYSSSANVRASAYSYSGGPVVSIGDVRFETLSRRGADNSAYVSLDAGEDGSGGGNIGNISITFNELGGGSSELDLYASAFADANGAGGNIGDIRLINTGYRGNTYTTIHSDTSVKSIYVAMGPGSSNADINLYGAGDVGDITVALHPENSNTTSYVKAYADSAQTEIGLIRVIGGSPLSNFRFSDDTALSVAGIDMSQYAGSAYIDLDDIDIGTVIKTPRDESYVRGTSAADEIYLGAGEDEVYLPTPDSDSKADQIYGIEASSAGYDELTFDFDVYQFQTDTDGSDGPASANPGAASLVADADLIRLIDPGVDGLTSAALLAKLNAAGEFANFDATSGVQGEALVAVAASASSTDWKLFKLIFDGSDAEFDSAHLLAVVRSNVTLADAPPILGIIPV
jgi:hypothetical protein